MFILMRKKSHLTTLSLCLFLFQISLVPAEGKNLNHTLIPIGKEKKRQNKNASNYFKSKSTVIKEIELKLVKRLEKDHLNIFYQGKNYHYSKGLFYKFTGSSFIITQAPIGIKINESETLFQEINVEGRKLFFLQGTFYRKVKSGYIVIEPTIGCIVQDFNRALVEEIQINGELLINHWGNLYKPITSESITVLKFVGVLQG